jgi:hypothetical protein
MIGLAPPKTGGAEEMNDLSEYRGAICFCNENVAECAAFNMGWAVVTPNHQHR